MNVVARLVFPMLLAGVLMAPAETAVPEPEIEELPVHEHERLLVLAPHPDDETLATGGLIQRVLENHGTVRVVTLTAGDGYREALARRSGDAHPSTEEFKEYGRTRIDEVQAAVAVLGKKAQVSVLGFPDGGLASVLQLHWARTHPARSATTGETSPPYAEAADHRLKYDGADLRAKLLRIVRETDPTLVVFPDPYDRHPDHATTGLFALLALNDWADQTHKRPSELPRMLADIVHWPGWPAGAPDGMTQAEVHALPLVPPAGLPRPDRPVVQLTLTSSEVETKARALHEHRTQQEAMGEFLSRFERRTEPFRVMGPSDLDAVETLVDEVRARAAARAEAMRSDGMRDEGVRAEGVRAENPHPENGRRVADTPKGEGLH